MSVFSRDRPRGNMAIPRPVDGENVAINPPGFVWNPAEGASSYRIEICDSQGQEIYATHSITDPLHLPDQKLSPGGYEWDLAALDQNGKMLGQRGKQKFIVPNDAPILPWVPPNDLLSRVPDEHPRLIFLKSDLPNIRESLKTARRKAWDQVKQAADSFVGLEPPPYPSYHLIEDPKRCRLEYVDYFRGIGRYVDSGLQTLALAYLMSEDMRYGESARHLLMAFAEWPVDDADVTSVLAKWGDEPGLHLARICHRAYDWIYDILDDAQREKALAMCAGRARQALRRLRNRHNYLTSPGESHAGRLIAYLSEMAIAMAGEAEDAAEWLEYSLKALMTFYPHWGGRDGGWAEGISYGQGYNSIYLGAVECLRTIGLDLWKRPLQRNVRKFFLYCTVPGAEMRPYGDGADRGGRNVGLAELMRHHARRFSDPACQWWADQLPLSRTPDPLLALMTEDNVESVRPAGLPQAKVFRDVGWAALHSHLAEPEKDTFLLFKSSPYGSVSHSHADQNSFSILKGGKALAIPSGYYGPSYGQPHHAEWTRQTRANNSVLVNGDGQIVREAWARGRITDFADDRQMAYVCGDAAEAYGGKMAHFVRHVLFARPALFVVLDEIAAPQPSRFHWLLHGLEEMDVDESVGAVVLKHAGKSLEVRICSPGGMSFSQTDAFDTPYNAGIPEDFHREMPNQWHLTASTDDLSRETRICATMLVTADGENISWEGRDMDGWTGAVASGPGWTAEVWAQLVPGTSGPHGFGETVSDGKAKIAGRWASRVNGEKQVLVR
jgi:hypothetical protein